MPLFIFAFFTANLALIAVDSSKPTIKAKEPNCHIIVRYENEQENKRIEEIQCE